MLRLARVLQRKRPGDIMPLTTNTLSLLPQQTPLHNTSLRRMAFLKDEASPRFIRIGAIAERQAEAGKKYTLKRAMEDVEELIASDLIKDFDKNAAPEYFIHTMEGTLTFLPQIIANADLLVMDRAPPEISTVFRCLMHMINGLRKGDTFDSNVYAVLHNILFNPRFSKMEESDLDHVRLAIFCASAHVNTPGLTLFTVSSFNSLPIFQRSLSYFPYLTYVVSTVLEGRMNSAFDRRLRGVHLLHSVDLEALVPALLEAGYSVIEQITSYIIAQDKIVASMTKSSDPLGYESKVSLVAQWRTLLISFTSKYANLLNALNMTSDVFPLIQSITNVLSSEEVERLYVQLIEAAIAQEKYLPAMELISVMRRENISLEKSMGLFLFILAKTENLPIAKNLLASGQFSYASLVSDVANIRTDRWQNNSYVINSLFTPTSMEQLWEVMYASMKAKRPHIVLNMFNSALSSGLMPHHAIPTEIARLCNQALVRVGVSDARHPILFKKDNFDPILLDPETAFIFLEGAHTKYPPVLVMEFLLSIRLGLYAAEITETVPLPAFILEADRLYKKHGKSPEYSLLRNIQKIRYSAQKEYHSQLASLQNLESDDPDVKSRLVSRYIFTSYLESTKAAEASKPAKPTHKYSETQNTFRNEDAPNNALCLRLDKFFLDTFVELEISTRFLSRREWRTDDMFFSAFWTACSLQEFAYAQSLLNYAAIVDPSFLLESYYNARINELIKVHSKFISYPLEQPAFPQLFQNGKMVGENAVLENPFVQGGRSDYPDLIMTMRQQLLMYKDVGVPVSYLNYRYSRDNAQVNRKEMDEVLKQSAKVKNAIELRKMTPALDPLKRTSPVRKEAIAALQDKYQHVDYHKPDLFSGLVKLIRRRYAAAHGTFRDYEFFQPLDHPPYKSNANMEHSYELAQKKIEEEDYSVRVNEPNFYAAFTGINVADRFTLRDHLPLITYDEQQLINLIQRLDNSSEISPDWIRANPPAGSWADRDLSTERFAFFTEYYKPEYWQDAYSTTMETHYRDSVLQHRVRPVKRIPGLSIREQHLKLKTKK